MATRSPWKLASGQLKKLAIRELGKILKIGHSTDKESERAEKVQKIFSRHNALCEGGAAQQKRGELKYRLDTGQAQVGHRTRQPGSHTRAV